MQKNHIWLREYKKLLVFDSEKKLLKASAIYSAQNTIKSISDNFNPAEFAIKEGESYIEKILSSNQSFLLTSSDLGESDEKLINISKDKDRMSILYLPINTKQKILGVYDVIILLEKKLNLRLLKKLMLRKKLQ